MRAVLDFAQQGGADYLRHVRANIMSATTAEVARGDPARSIVSAAKRVNADLIVMGTHGHGAMYNLLVGSVTKGVIKHSARPVLLIPAPRA